MIKIIADINSTLHYVSTEEINTGAQPYKAEVASLSGISCKAKTKTGGFVQPSFGEIVFLPDTFEDDYPPPFTIGVNITFFDNLILDGIGQLKGLPLDSVGYNLYGPEYDSLRTIGFTGTFFNFFSAAAATLGLSLDTSIATDYNVTFTLSSDTLLIDVMHKMAASLNHGFYIDNGTIYLIDTAEDDGTEIVIDEFALFSSDYQAPTPYSLFKNADETLQGDYPHGNEYSMAGGYQTNTSDMQAQLARAKVILDKFQITIKIPVQDNPIKYGQKLTFTDTSRIKDLSVTMWAREFNYTITDDQEQITIVGEGDVI